MTKTTVVEIDAGAPAGSMDDIDLMLADLEVEEQGEVEIETLDDGDIVLDDEPATEPVEAADETAADDASEEDLAAVVGALEIEDVKAEVYAEAEAGEEASAPAATPGGHAATTKRAKRAEPKPRAAKIADDLPAEHFVLDTEDDMSDLEALKAKVLASKPNQKKILEKFHNVLTSVAGGRKPSVYVMVAYRALKSKGEVTSSEIVAALQAASRKNDASKNYSIGTARSQAGQCMALFPILKIATREGNKLKLNPNSTLAIALDALEDAADESAAEEKEAA